MTPLLIIGGSLALLGAGLHGALGGFVLFFGRKQPSLGGLAPPSPLGFLVPPRGGVDEQSRHQWRYLHAGWQLLTVDAVLTGGHLLAAGLGWASLDVTAAGWIALRFTAYGVVWLALVAIPARMLLRAPQWLLFFGIAACIWAGGAA